MVAGGWRTPPPRCTAPHPYEALMAVEAVAAVGVAFHSRLKNIDHALKGGSWSSFSLRSDKETKHYLDFQKISGFETRGLSSAERWLGAKTHLRSWILVPILKIGGAILFGSEGERFCLAAHRLSVA